MTRPFFPTLELPNLSLTAPPRASLIEKRGTPGNDSMVGTGDGDVHGGVDNDLMWGGTYCDKIAGGAGNDTVIAGIGWDSLSWTETAGPRTRDLYIGGIGIDILTLHLTRGTWLSDATQAEVQAFYAATQEAGDDGVNFHFLSLGLTASSIRTTWTAATAC